jgi:hypothetical protein
VEYGCAKYEDLSTIFDPKEVKAKSWRLERLFQITALKRLTQSHEDLRGCLTHSPEEALAIYAKSWRLERRYYELRP